MTALVLPRPRDWLLDEGIYVPSREWFRVPKHLRREIRFGRVEEAIREFLKVLGLDLAITETNLTSGSSSTDATSYTTGSFTATSGSVQIAVVSGQQAFGSARTPTASGWTQIATINMPANTYSLTAFWKMTSGSTTVTFDFGANTMSSAAWAVQEFAGVDGTTPINANKVTNSGSGTSLAITLGAFADANNGAFACWNAVNVSLITYTPGTGWNEIYDFQHSEAFAGHQLQTQWRADNDTSVDATISSSSAWIGIACELVAASAGGILGQLLSGGSHLNGGILKGRLVGR